MTLYDLMESITIQGHIRLSVWEDDEAIAVAELNFCEGLDCYELDKVGVADWNMYEVKYMFCGGDEMLHIELEKGDD